MSMLEDQNDQRDGAQTPKLRYFCNVFSFPRRRKRGNTLSHGLLLAVLEHSFPNYLELGYCTKQCKL